MKKEDLIRKIQVLVPDGGEVVLFDPRKNLNDMENMAGIQVDIPVVSFSENDVVEGTLPFSALIIVNDDYNEDGTISNEALFFKQNPQRQ